MMERPVLLEGSQVEVNSGETNNVTLNVEYEQINWDTGASFNTPTP